jgi:hypothetical protein
VLAHLVSREPALVVGRTQIAHRVVDLGCQYDFVTYAGRASNQLPMISSERPRAVSPPYTFAVSMKVMPMESALSKIACDSSSVALGPKCIVPRQILLTFMPERPSSPYFI